MLQSAESSAFDKDTSSGQRCKSGIILVLVLHGIRDHGAWMEMVKSELHAIDNVRVQLIDFDFYNALFFMTGINTRRIVADARHKIQATIAAVPHSELIVIAHSFGTYVITEILRESSSFIHVHRMIFCGSVVSRRFQFDRINHPPYVLNECGGRDIWPILAQGFRLFTAGEFGAAGVFGLRQPCVEDRYHDFGHSTYLEREFIRTYWVPYIKTNTILPSPYEANRRKTPLAISYIASSGWVMLIGWIALLAYGEHPVGVPMETAAYVSLVTRPLCGAIAAWVALSLWRYCYAGPEPSPDCRDRRSVTRPMMTRGVTIGVLSGLTLLATSLAGFHYMTLNRRKTDTARSTRVRVNSSSDRFLTYRLKDSTASMGSIESGTLGTAVEFSKEFNRVLVRWDSHSNLENWISMDHITAVTPASTPKGAP